MDRKPKAIKLVNLEEELLHSGRKLLHCIFEDRYGNLRFSYRWTAPYRGKEGDYGIEHLFFSSLQVEEWNDPSGVWTQELKKVSEEVPSLGELKLPVEIGISEAIEDIKVDNKGVSREYWKICIEISNDEQDVYLYQKDGNQFLSIGQIRMSWEALKREIFQTGHAKYISKEMSPVYAEDSRGYILEDPVLGIQFWIWLEKAADRVQYETTTRDIAFRIRSFIRSRLSEYKSLKKGFQE